MNILIGFLIVVEVIVSLLLILIILVQPSKGSGGLGGALGGGMGEQLFGARAGNVLTKGTILFASIFLLNTLALAWLYSRPDTRIENPTPAGGIQAPSGLPETEAPQVSTLPEESATEPASVVPVTESVTPVEPASVVPAAELPAPAEPVPAEDAP